MKFKLLALATAFIASSAFASVTYDDNGVGFVGKGDIQSLFDWNNAMLQQNAANLEFRFVAAGTVTWICEWYTGPEHNTKRHAVEAEASSAVSASVAFDSRKNSKGQITGFTLNGAEEASTEQAAIGECKGYGAGKTLVPDSVNYSGAEEPVLQVRVAGGDWLDLPVSL